MYFENFAATFTSNEKYESNNRQLSKILCISININSILDFCIDANVKGVLNLDMGFSLRKGNREYFYGKLDEHFPGLRQRYVEEFGERNFIYSANNRKLKKIIENRCRKHRMLYRQEDIIEYMHEFPCTSIQSKLM